MTSSLREAARQALQQEHLRRALEQFAAAYPPAREEALAEVGFAQSRQELLALRTRNIEAWEQLSQQFAEIAGRQGCKVFFASRAEEARAYVLTLARAKGVSRVVKAKSMTAEEIGLNGYLAAAGVQVLETDLGEWIIQLGRQKPSHPVLPAIHLSRRGVTSLLQSCFPGELAGEEIADIVNFARRKLRAELLSASMGISGANMAIAETGSLAVLSNEGNASLVTLAPIHVSIFGLEKLVRTVEEATALLEVLPPSATGQHITSYVSFLAGPLPGQERHIILLDNGRQSLRRHAGLKAALRCIRCGACLNVCPVYQELGGHVFGGVYIGAIGAVWDRYCAPEYGYPRFEQYCMACGQCRTVCPVGIDLPALIYELRLLRPPLQSLGQRAVASVLRQPRLSWRVGISLQKPWQDKKAHVIRNLPGPLAGWTRSRHLAPLARHHLWQLWPQRERTAPGQPRVHLFAGCLVGYVLPNVGLSLARAMETLGKVALPVGQTCCGLPALSAGNRKVALAQAKQNIRVLEAADAIVTPCPTCTHTLMHLYPEWLHGEPGWTNRAQQVAAKTVEVAKLLLGLGLDKKITPQLSSRAVYHAPCHARHYLGLEKEPQQLLARTGLTFLPLADACCGFGGAYSFTQPEIADSLLRKRLHQIQKTGAEKVITDCPGCLLQLNGGLQKTGVAIAVEHSLEVLAQALRGSEHFSRKGFGNV